MDRSPQLTWSEAGAPISGRFGDVYFSREDGLAESRAVFLQGCGLPGAWAGRRRFVVGELGFGSGLNIAALLDLWVRSRPTDGRLHIFSVEGFPLSRDEAARALAAWPELAPVVDRLLDQWPSPTPGFHRLAWPDIGVTFDLAVGEAVQMLEAWSGKADAWFLDGFAPAVNPGMWSDAVLDMVAARSAPGARAATFTVAGAIRRGLAANGFVVSKRPGYGRKRERLEATAPGTWAETSAPDVAVIGAGVAGAATARALVDLGLAVTVIEQDRPGSGASGFPAALVTPRLDAGDGSVAALFAQALERAGRAYRDVGAVIERGVLQLESAPRDATRFTKIAAQPWWPAGAMEVHDAAACTVRLGELVTTGGLMMQDAMAIEPRMALDRWLDGVEVRHGAVARVEAEGGGWCILGARGQVVLRAQAVVIAGGWGAQTLAPHLDLAPVKGQADWVEGLTNAPVAWGGYVVPTRSGLLYGATHDRGLSDAETSDIASNRNRDQLAARLPTLATRLPSTGERRAAVRATTRDRLPIAGALQDKPGLFVLTGLGSRGFCLAPLLGEHVASMIAETPSPLPNALAARIAPQRLAAILKPKPALAD